MNQITIIQKNLKAQIEGKEVLPMCIFSEPGTGKTSLVKQSAKDLNAGLSHYALSSINYEALSGLPEFTKEANMDSYSVSGVPARGTIWTIPQIIHDTNLIAEDKGSAILLLDDIHTMDKTTSNVMYELLLERRIGNWKLHPKVAIICAMNHSKEAGGGSFHSSAVKSRLNLQPYNFNFNIWYEGFGRFLHPLVSSFLYTNQQYTVERECKTLEASASPRSWSKISEEFNLYTNEELVSVDSMLLQGVVSPNAVQAYNKHVTYYRKLDFKSMVQSRKLPDIEDMPELDKVLLGYIFHSIYTIEDSIYMIDLMNHVAKQPNSDTVIGFLASELVTQYLKQSGGITIPIGQDIILQKILQTFDVKKYKTTSKNKPLLINSNLTNRDEILTVMSGYING